LIVSKIARSLLTRDKSKKNSNVGEGFPSDFVIVGKQQILNDVDGEAVVKNCAKVRI
jgi:hypothetical protein